MTDLGLTINIMLKERKEYLTPTVELLEARVEKGFAGSGSNQSAPIPFSMEDQPSLPALGDECDALYS